MFHEACRVIAYCKKGNLIFDSMIEACEYFSSDRQKLSPVQLRRIIEKNGVWCYEDEDGTYSDIIFDELYEGEKNARH